MGGYGSGRWGWHRHKPLVEHCIRLDVLAFVRKGYLKAGAAGTCTAGKNAFTWKVIPHDDSPATVALQLDYAVTIKDGEPRNHTHVIPLETTTYAQSDKVRWWFLCPECETRRATLFLHWGSRVHSFACRSCRGLVYRSSRNSRKMGKAEALFHYVFNDAHPREALHLETALLSPMMTSGSLYYMADMLGIKGGKYKQA